MNQVKKMRYWRRVLSKQRVSQVSGLCDILYVSCSAKCTTQLKYTNRDAGKEWQRLEFTLTISSAFFSLLSLQTFTPTLYVPFWLFKPQKHWGNCCFTFFSSRLMSCCTAKKNLNFKLFYFQNKASC